MAVTPSVVSSASTYFSPSGVMSSPSYWKSYSVPRVSGVSISVMALRFLSCMPSVKLRANSSTTAHSVPIRMKGVRLPRRLRHLSLIAPNSGSMNRARMLSSAMMMPLLAWFMPNLSVRILGIRLS